MNLCEAIELLKHDKNKFATRPAMLVGHKIKVQVPDEHSKMTRLYLYLEVYYMDAVKCDAVPWAPTQDDILSTDWIVHK